MLFPSRAIAAILVLVSATLTVSCGSSSPTAPTAPVIAQVGGVWRGTATRIAATGGECLAPLVASTVTGLSAVSSASITQTGAHVDVTIADQATGGSCVFAGTMGESAMQLSWVSCSASNSIGARCPSGVGLRDILLQTSTISATVFGGSMTGTKGDTYNVVTSGTLNALGTVNVQTSFTFTRQ